MSGEPQNDTSWQSNTPRRKRLLINPAFQAAFALYAALTTLLMVPIFVAANYYFFNLFATKAKSVGLPPDHQLIQFVDAQQTLMVVVFIFASLLAVVISVIVSYVVSNRIAGSIYRLTAAMNQATDLASIKTVTARKSDFFKEMYDAYNHLINRLKH